MPSVPKTTPECKRLQDLVIKGLKANIFDTEMRESARVALKRLRKKRCTQSLEYIIEVSCGSSPLDVFAREVCKEATKYLNELS